MKKILASLLLAVAGSIAFAAGCTVAVDTGPGGGGVVVSCNEDDDPCDVDEDCCSYLCAEDGYCGLPADDCNEDDDPCDFDDDCCSGLCADDGYCGLP